MAETEIHGDWVVYELPGPADSEPHGFIASTEESRD